MTTAPANIHSFIEQELQKELLRFTTAGSVDDAVVAGDRVKNAVGASAIGVPSGSFAEFEIARPWMDDAVAA